MTAVTSLDDIEPVERESTASIVADKLREAIMRGSLEPGTQLGEAELANQLGVSRGPLREAMQRLVQEGLLRSERHKGLFVIELDGDGIRDVYWVRRIVEHAAADLILARDVDPLAERLDEAHDLMRQAAEGPEDDTTHDADDDESNALVEADLAFHEAFVAESGSLRLVRMTRTLLVETRMCLSMLADTYEFPSQVAEEHADMVQAIRDHDGDELHRLVDAHIDDALRRLTTAYAEHTD